MGVCPVYFELMALYKNRILITLGAFLAFVFVYQLNVPQAEAISISPLTFEMTANPGETLSNVIEITNREDSVIQVQMSVQDFTASGEGGKVVVVEDSNQTYSLAKWITIQPQAFVLEPNERKIVTFIIDVPLDGEPGGHYGSVLAQKSSGGAVGGSSVSQKIGTLLLLQVAGEVKEEMWLTDFRAPSFSEHGPVILSGRYENIGSVHLKPQGFITITNMFGKEKEQVPLPARNVLPNSVRRIETQWGSKWMFGRYTATLTAIYGSTNEPLTATTTFWVFPWKIGAAVGGVFLVFFIMLFLMRRRIRLAFRIMFKGEHHL